MNVLITGGAGFIGTNLIRHLKKYNYNLISVDNYSTGSRENHQINCEYFELDLSNNQINDLKNIDFIFHLAAVARIKPSFDNPNLYFKNNVIATQNITQYACKNKIPIVYAGTSSRNGGKFKNPYTFTKELGEDIIKLYRKNFNLKATIARFYNVYGPYEPIDNSYSTLIGRWKNNYKKQLPFVIYGDGSKKRDFTSVKDICKGLHLILKKNAFNYNFEFGKGKNYSVLEIAKMFEYENIIYENNIEGEIQESLCKSKKAKKILRWKPKDKVENYIKNIIKY